MRWRLPSTVQSYSDGRRGSVTAVLPKGVVQRHSHRLHDLQADVKVRPYGVRVKDIVGAISALRATVGGNVM